MQYLERIVEYAKPLTAQFVIAAVMLILVWLVYLLVLRALKAMHAHGKLPAPLVIVIRRILRWIVALAALALVLQAFGLLENAWTAFTAVAAMIAIGFVAVWSVMSNGLCSLIILIMRPFRVGDQIELPPDDIKGKVVNFNMIFTTLRSEDGTLIQVPNNMFFQRVIRRRPGKSKIGLDEQLMQEQDAKV